MAKAETKTRAPRAPKDPSAPLKERKPHKVNPHRAAALAYSRALVDRDKLTERVQLRSRELDEARANLKTCEQTINQYVESMNSRTGEA